MKQVLSQNAFPTSRIVGGRVVGSKRLIHPPKPNNFGLWIYPALKRCFSSIRNFFSIQKVLFQHPGFSQHPRCFISTCGVFPTPERECFRSIRKVFFDDQVFSPRPKVFFQHQLMSNFLSTEPRWYFLSIKVFSPHPRCFFST